MKEAGSLERLSSERKRVVFVFHAVYPNSPVLGRLLLEKEKYEYKQIVCG